MYQSIRIKDKTRLGLYTHTALTEVHSRVYDVHAKCSYVTTTITAASGGAAFFFVVMADGMV